MALKLDAMKDIAPNVTITVRIVNLKQLKIRLNIARWLIMLAGRVANMNIKFEDKPYYGTDI